MKLQSIRGVKDILPNEIWKWQWVEFIAHKIFPRYGFKEIRIPIFEDTRLFSRSIGETTDIVEKEMYTFEDRGGDSITLRPEGTASVVVAEWGGQQRAIPTVSGGGLPPAGAVRGNHQPYSR